MIHRLLLASSLPLLPPMVPVGLNGRTALEAPGKSLTNPPTEPYGVRAFLLAGLAMLRLKP